MDESLRLPPRLESIVADLPLDELAFEPVPVKPRRDGWTAERQRAFILRLALIGCVAAAAKAVGKSRESAYRLRARSGAASFAAAWDEALFWGWSRANDLALDRIVNGEVRGIYYRGRKVAEEVRHDNGLLIAVLRQVPALPVSGDEPSGAVRGDVAHFDSGRSPLY